MNFPTYSVTWTFGITLDQIKAKVIRQALIQYKGNKTHAAKALGISLRTLKYWVNEHEILEEYRRPDLRNDAQKNRAKA